MSADPHIQDPLNLQSYNRYAYCMGNPMVCNDPSGYFSLGSFFRTVVAIAVAVYAPQFIASSAFAGPVATATGLSTVTVGAISAGAISGAISTGSIQGALTGGLSAGLFGGLHGMDAGIGKVLAHGMVGGVLSEMSGGSFRSGFLAAAFTQTASQMGAFNNLGDPKTFSGRAQNAIAAAVVGGTASVIGGGKFSNGALTGAFSRLFNDLRIVEYDGAMGFGHVGAGSAEDLSTDGFYPRSALIAAGLDPTAGVIKNDMTEGGKTENNIRKTLIVKSSPEQDAAFSRRFYSSARSYDFNSNQGGAMNCATRVLDALIYAKILPQNVPRPVKPTEVMKVIETYAPK